MNEADLARGLEQKLKDMPEGERVKIVESTQTENNKTRDNSLNSFPSYPNQESNQRPSRPTLENEALHGLVGEIVRTIDPYTEADQVALP